MAEKPKVAFYWCASCGGCEEAIVDLAEQILDVVEAVDIVFWPVALDFKVDDVEAMKDGSIAASFINGAIRLSEHEEMAKLLRKKSKLVFAFGACAHLGGVPGLANQWNRDAIFDYYYHTGPTVEEGDGQEPLVKFETFEGFVQLPEFWNQVKALDEVIKVDYYVPGCAPTPNVVANAVTALLSGKLPPPGTVLAGDRALCYECPLNDSKPEKLLVSEIKRVHEAEVDPETCLLAQGLLCLGPVTRGGCDALCVKGYMPCTGCFGPVDEVMDQGAKGISFLSSIVQSDDEEELLQIFEKLPDPLGVFYRYSLARLPLTAKREVKLGG